jgi:hypothetical protein
MTPQAAYTTKTCCAADAGNGALESLQAAFQQGDVIQITDFIDGALAETLASRAVEMVDGHGIKRDGYPKRGGRSLHAILDGFVVDKHFRELAEIYDRARALAEAVVQKDVVLSPHQRSGVNIRVYRGAESEDGWHYDSNPLSALLYLTNGGQPTQFQVTESSLMDIYPRAGTLLLFEGRSKLHHVPKGSELRVTCPLNLYYVTDLARPDRVDQVLFENSDGMKRSAGESGLS